MAKRGEIVRVPDEQWQDFQRKSVFATHDYIVEVEGRGILLVRKRIAPYKDVWALPGLRQLSGEAYADTGKRILKDELGIAVTEEEIERCPILGQFDGFFETRQDISTGRLICLPNETEIKLNEYHFYPEARFINSPGEIPEDAGEMYRFYLLKYFELRVAGKI